MDRTLENISLSGVSKSFPGSSGKRKTVLNDVSMDFEGHSLITLIGPNGCGKSTLLNLIAGILKPDAGTIQFTTNQRDKPKIGYVWQDYRASLLPWLNVMDNISFPLRLRGVKKKERDTIARTYLSEFLPDIDPKGPTYKLSGGQQQLISLLRSAVSEPDLFLLDEPFSALDQQRRWSMASFVERFWMRQQKLTLFVTHDIDEGILLADKIFLMSKQGGTIIHQLTNTLPRPRTISMLTSKEHLHCRKEILDFLLIESH